MPADPMSPERVREIADGFIETWKADRGPIIARIAVATGLSRLEVFLLLALNDLGIIRDEITRQTKHVEFDPTCEKCQREKDFQERQMQLLKLMEQHLDDDDDWKEP